MDVTKYMSQFRWHLTRLRRLVCPHAYVLVDSKVTEMAPEPGAAPVTVQLLLSQCQHCGRWDVLDSEIDPAGLGVVWRDTVDGLEMVDVFDHEDES